MELCVSLIKKDCYVVINLSLPNVKLNYQQCLNVASFVFSYNYSSLCNMVNGLRNQYICRLAHESVSHIKP